MNENIKIIIILFICILNYINSFDDIIKINFERYNKYNYELNETNFFEYTYFYYIYTFIDIGTPPVKIPILISDKQSILNIYSYNFTDKNLTYNLNNSLSFKLNNNNDSENELYDDYYSDKEYVSGYKSNENFIINNENINLNFLCENKINEQFLKGILGLNTFFYSEQKDLINYSLIKQLKQQDKIKSYDFSINYQNRYDILSKGEIIIGDLPHNYNKNFNEKNYHFVNAKFYTHDPVYTSIKIDEINYNFNLKNKNKILNLDDDTETILDINIGYIFGTETFYNIIYNEFFSEYINNNKCIEYNIQRSYKSYYCDKDIDLKKMKNLYFQIKKEKINFVLTPNDLFYKFQNKLYYLIIFNPYYKTNKKWILGIPFFTKYMINFNQDKKIIGFYVNEEIIKENNNKLIFKLLIISILFGFIFFLISMYYIIFKKNRKIRANELEDNIDYSSYK